jgi:ribose/xylose/arabinose/galactoside ABC-type transport system permease subunit
MTATDVHQGTLEQGQVRRDTRSRVADNGILVAFALLVGGLMLASPTFRTLDNMFSVGEQSAILAVAAFAMTLVIVCGTIDLSVGAVASAAGVVAAMRLSAGDPPLLAVLVGLLVATGFGALNAAVVVVGRVPSFIATLATFYVAQGLSLSLTGGQTLPFDAPGFRSTFATADLLGVPVSLAWAVLVFLALGFLLHCSRTGASLFAVGGDETSARMLGLPVDRGRFLVLTLSGALMGLVAMILIARIGNARSDGAIGLEFDAIAAVVIGGTSFAGGRGSLLRTVVGVLFIGVLNNGLALLNVDFNTQQVVKGVLVIAAVLLDRWARGARRQAA